MVKLSPLQRFNQVLLAFLLFFGILYLARPFLIPLAIGGLFAMLLVPVCHKLEKWGVSRTLAALISVLAVVFILVALLVVLINQITNLTNDLPQLGQELSVKLDSVRTETPIFSKKNQFLDFFDFPSDSGWLGILTKFRL